MSKKISKFIGIDIDDKAYHVSVYQPSENTFINFKTGSSPELLLKALKKYKITPGDKICYEASYIGYSLYRALTKAGYFCQIIAPSLIPRQPGMKQKTDKIDAKKLSEYYSKDLLHVITIPDETDEAVRDLLRSKLFVKSTLTKVKNHILAMCRRLGINYRMETDKKSHWTTHHLAWLTGRISKLENKITIKNFRILFKQFEDLNSSIGLYENEIEAISCEKRYKDKVNTLLAFKGVKKESALTLITELGDIKRFDHPKRITSYAGFDLVEYSSGGKERKSGISKMGNSNIRKIAVSAVQYSIRSPVAGVELRRRRKNCNAKVLQIASKCDARLHKKGSRMLYAGKPIMKIQVACAREFLGFIWEALNEAA